MTNATPTPRKRAFQDIVREWSGYVLLLALALALSIGFLPRAIINGSSMDTTLHDGQHLIAVGTKLNPFVEPQRGDIVIADSDVLDTVIVKRLIALPGDTMEITANRVYVNGQELEEPYINGPMITGDIPSFTLGEDDYFLMGDNRNFSADSRRIGCVDRSAIMSIVYLDYQVPLAIAYIGLVLLLAYFGYRHVDRFCTKKGE